MLRARWRRLLDSLGTEWRARYDDPDAGGPALQAATAVATCRSVHSIRATWFSAHRGDLFCLWWAGMLENVLLAST